MREIQITQGYTAIVDDEDFEYLNQWKWSALITKRKCVYAKRGQNNPITKAVKTIYMARVIMGVEDPSIIVDHISRDTLDNRKENLRVTSQSKNKKNRGLGRNNTSGFKGVTWRKDREDWVAKIGLNGGEKFLGFYNTKEDAALAYNEAAIKYYGEFACLNEIPIAV